MIAETQRSEVLGTLKDFVLGVPEVAGFPALSSVVERLGASEIAIWDYPFFVCEAVGQERAAALPAAASLLCLCTSINIVDDILDGDSGGPLDEYGPGRTANMAQALQAVATKILLDSPLSQQQQRESLTRANDAGLATTRGQDLDTEICQTESDYWRMVEAKSTPLVSAAAAMGAIAGGCTPSVIDSMAEIGKLLGTIVQINDDLSDAMEQPAKTDWQRPANNLALLYATTANYPERERLLELLPAVSEHDCLVEAQLILTRHGAVGFCVYRLVELYRKVHEIVDSLSLPAPERLDVLLRRHTVPTEALLEEAGIEAPAALWERRG